MRKRDPVGFPGWLWRVVNQVSSRSRAVAKRCRRCWQRARQFAWKARMVWVWGVRESGRGCWRWPLRGSPMLKALVM